MPESIRTLLAKDTWEFKTLEEIATDIYSGNGVTEAQLGQGTTPAVKNKDISKLPYHFCDCRSFVNPDEIANKKYFEYGDLLISNMGSKRDVGKGCTYLGQEKCLAGNHVIVVKHNQNPKFLAYVLTSKYCRDQINKFMGGSIVSELKITLVRKIKVPLPPLHVQELIADILDKWTDLQEELARELECRKKQYQYYKELVLISEANKWEYKNLGEIATGIYAGSGITKSQLGTGSYPVIRYSDVHKVGLFIHKCDSGLNLDLIQNHKYCEFGDLLIAKFSEDVEGAGKHTVYLGEQRPIVDMNTCILKHDQNPKYLSYALSTHFCRQQAQNLSLKSTVVYFKQGPLKQIKVPLPPLEEQEKIVSLLDPLYEMCGDAEKGIPALISVIQKQYLYYKEELLKVQGNLS